MADLNPWHILSAVMTAFTAMLTWLGLVQIKRIDALERERASTVFVAAEVSKVYVEIAKLEKGQDRIVDRINDMQGATNVRLDNIFRELVSRQ